MLVEIRSDILIKTHVLIVVFLIELTEENVTITRNNDFEVRIFENSRISNA